MENIIEENTVVNGLTAKEDSFWDEVLNGDEETLSKPNFVSQLMPNKAIKAYLNEGVVANTGEPFISKAQTGGIKLIQPQSSNNANIVELRKRYSVLLMNGKTRVASKGYRGGIELIDIKSFHDFYGYLYECVAVGSKGASRIEYATQDFMRDAKTPRYLGLTFNPRNDQPSSIWNLWEGFKVGRKEGDVSLYLELVAALCNYNESDIKYFLDWQAHMVQKPWELPETAVVLRGEQGIGKGTIMKILGRFSNHYLHLSSSRPLVGNFNGILATAFLVFCDESIWGGSKDAEGTLKALITESEHSINEKNEKEFMVENYKRFIFASNEDWAAPVGLKDRRYFVLDCSSKYKGQTGPDQFFGKIDKAIKDEGLVEAVFDFLMKRDISDIDIRTAPKTAGYVDLMSRGYDVPTRFIYELISDVADLSEETVEYDGKDGARWNRKKLYADFIEWCGTHNVKHINSSNELGKTINKIFDFSKVSENWRTNWKDRTKGFFYQVPTRAESMKLFAKNMNGADVKLVFPDYQAYAPLKFGMSKDAMDPRLEDKFSRK